MARGGLPGTVSGTKVRAARGEVAAAKVVDPVGHPEIVGVRVFLHERQDAVLRDGRSFRVSDDRMLSVSGAGGEIAQFGYWVGAELMLAPPKRKV